VSNFGPADLGEWCAHADCVSNQVAYNLAFRAVEYDIVPDCAERNVGILAYMPVMQGFLAGIWDSVEDIPPVRRRTRQFSSEREGTRHGEPGCETELFDLLAGLRRVADGHSAFASITLTKLPCARRGAAPREGLDAVTSCDRSRIASR